MSQNTVAEIMAELGLQGSKPPRWRKSLTWQGKRNADRGFAETGASGSPRRWRPRFLTPAEASAPTGGGSRGDGPGGTPAARTAGPRIGPKAVQSATMAARAQASPVITERRNAMITRTCARPVAEVPHRAYLREL